jgi:hypothetical protein
VHITLRLSISLLVTLVTLFLASTALAEPRHGPSHRPGQNRPNFDHRPDEVRPGTLPAEELNLIPGNAAVHRARARHGCRRSVRPRADVRCDYYYDGDDDEEQAAPDLDPGGSAQPQAEPGAAKIAPMPHPEDHDESFTPHGGEQLKEKLIAARKNWVTKKNQLEEASAANARAEYQAEKTGRPVDPALFARQQEARQEAEAAHAAIAPLVEQGHEAGMSPKVLELYERMTEFE